MPDRSRGDLGLPVIESYDGPPARVPGAEVVALPLLPGDDGPDLGPGAAALLDEHDVDLLALAAHAGATGKVGDLVEHPVLGEGPLRAVLLVGVGATSSTDLRRAGAALARKVRGRSTVATSVGNVAEDDGAQAFVEGLVLGSFSYSLKTTDPSPAAGRFVVAAPGGVPQAVLDRAVTMARAGWRSRVLALTPSNLKNPPWLADQAIAVAKAAGLDSKVWDEAALARDGFGGILGVGQASATPPRLVQLRYAPKRAGRRTPHVVLVGKGITFDTGGLSIKPAEAMTTMKRDMTGAGAVLSVMAELAAVGCPVRVTGLLACAENAVSGNALRPGDVLRHYGGRTSEVTNTDAEGRLVMADALAYAAAQLKPDVLVDIATLTGAVKVALGQRTGGLFANDDALADRLCEVGRAAGEPVWRLPLVADYEERLKSPIADADNAGGSPGAITAALFLQHFTGGLPWAHLDIASVGDSPVDAYEWTSGATGFGARLLLRWLAEPEPLAGVRSV